MIVLRKWVFDFFRVNTNAKGMFFCFILVVFSCLYLDSEPEEKIFRLCLYHLWNSSNTQDCFWTANVMSLYIIKHTLLGPFTIFFFCLHKQLRGKVEFVWEFAEVFLNNKVIQYVSQIHQKGLLF